MSDDIFSLLMIILMLENGGGTANVNQLVLMFLLMQNRSGNLSSGSNGSPCGDGGYTF
ncbi:MAG: hypothetical protein J1G38_02990 [Clostridiales bacterium]|nr:hypothetical protein [Clostridiales bacterium]